MGFLEVLILMPPLFQLTRTFTTIRILNQEKSFANSMYQFIKNSPMVIKLGTKKIPSNIHIKLPKLINNLKNINHQQVHLRCKHHTFQVWHWLIPFVILLQFIFLFLMLSPKEQSQGRKRHLKNLQRTENKLPQSMNIYKNFQISIKKLQMSILLQVPQISRSNLILQSRLQLHPN